MIGSVVGNYRIIDKIGEGGMGAVFKGVDLMLEREVAIKMLRPELARQPNVVERFRVEAVTLAKLNHPNVATLHSFFRQGEDFFMVMEFVRGETLDEVIRQRGAMPCDQAVELFCHALEGIDHAHKMGIVHRDIKPANMMLTDTGSIKVMDFGIARVLGSDRMTKTGHLVGTVEYMSPEQVRGEETDARSDIYSLGILLYEMLTGRVPFNSTSEYDLMRSQIEDAPPPPRSFAPHLPLAVEQPIMRALAKKREARFQSASEFRAMLIQRNTMGVAGAVTRPLIETAPRPGGYAAPVTDAGQTMRMTPVSPDAVKATRLAGDPGSVSPTLGEPKETRLGKADSTASYSQGAPRGEVAKPSVAGGHPQPGMMSKLSWKHLAAGGAALVAIVAVAVALVAGGGKAAAPAPPPEPEPAASTPSAPPPVTQEPAPPTAQPTVAAPVASQSAVPGTLDTPPATAGSSPARSRDGRTQKNTSEAPPVPTETAPPPQPSPAQTQTPPPAPPKQEKVDSAKPAEKKETAKTDEKKDEKKKGGIGGFFKKVFGGGDKNKNEKKP
ncbi:MAG: protein kinase [Blastocatellia bacterium]